jgi:hypothetical protein
MFMHPALRVLPVGRNWRERPRLHCLLIAGQLFLGKPFDALTADSPPWLLRYLNTALHALLFEGTYPFLSRILRCLPIHALQEFLTSGDRCYDVSLQIL